MAKILRKKSVALITCVLLITGCRTISELKLVGVFDSGLGEGSAEIISYDRTTNKAFVVNAEAGTVDVLELGPDGSLPEGEATFNINVQQAYPGLELGNANSVAAQDGIVAIAIENKNKQENGVVAFYSSDDYRLLNAVIVGALPDMVVFTPNGKKVVVANEGEPSDDYKIDPEGSVSIIHIDRKNQVASPSVFSVEFAEFNEGGPRHAELPQGVRVFGPNATVAQDLEPEYITISENSRKAWVVMQENNAIAMIDLKKQRVKKIIALGLKDHSLAGNELDASNRDDAINIRNWPVMGMYQPDAIDSYRVAGKTYLVTANEGDARDYWVDADEYANEAECIVDGGLEFDSEDGCLFFSEEVRVKDLKLDPVEFSDTELQENENLGRLKTTIVNGDTNSDGFYESIYSYGARSFSIWSASGSQIYDSGAQIAEVTAGILGLDLENETGFNAGDSRSDDKGAEPESVVIGYVDGKTYAFVGLERTGGIMIFDITDPNFVEYVLYFDEGPEHISPEGLDFVPASDSPTGQALLMVAHEISGTSTVYEIHTDFDQM